MQNPCTHLVHTYDAVHKDALIFRGSMVTTRLNQVFFKEQFLSGVLLAETLN